MLNNMTALMAKDAGGLINALQLAQNALLPEYIIDCCNSHKLFGPTPLPEFQRAVSSLNSSCSDFSKSLLQQMGSEYKCYHFMGKATAIFRKTYMSTSKEVNDVRCVAAEIGSILRTRLSGKNTLCNAIKEYQKWINDFFCYKNTGSINDHTAIGLLKNRTGVCQAIASLTTLILPHLGYSVRYISGEAFGGKGWGPHAWNAIKSNNKWIHVDFTFGLNSFNTPTNEGSVSKRLFSKTHKWDNSLSDNILSDSSDIQERLLCNTVEFFPNKRTFIFGNILIQTKNAVLVGSEEMGYWVDLSTLLPFFEGGYEYLPQNNCLRVCLKNKSFLVHDAMQYINQSTGYIALQAIRKFATISDGDRGFSIKLKMRCGNE